MSLMNISGAGVFSADRSIMDYAERIWHSKPVVFAKTEEKPVKKSAPKASKKTETKAKETKAPAKKKAEKAKKTSTDTKAKSKSKSKK